MFKKLLLTIALLFTSLYAYDVRLDSYPNGRALYEKASANDVDSAFDLGLMYQTKIKDYKEAAYWYKKSYKLGSIDASFNLGNTYREQSDYKNAEIWYKKAMDKGDSEAAINLGNIYKNEIGIYEKSKKYYKSAYVMGNMGGANNLGLLYELKLKDKKSAKEWYKKAATKGYSKSYKNLALFNRDEGNKVRSAAWYLALIDIKYSKQKVLTYLKTKWNLTDAQLKEAYKLQQTLDIPKHYTGGID